MTDEQKKAFESAVRVLGDGNHNRHYANIIKDWLASEASADTAGAKDRARRFVSDFTREMGFAMSDHAQEVMLNLFLRYAPSPAIDAAGASEDDVRDAARYRKFVEIRDYYRWSECTPEHVAEILDDCIAKGVGRD